MELIPDLPEEIARECLIRASYQQFPLMASVCKLWKREISLSDFFRHRKASGHSQELLVLSHSRIVPSKNIGWGRNIPKPVIQISVLELESSLWMELPPIPGQSNGLPLCCKLAFVGSDLVVLGGFDHDTLRISDSVFIFSFVTSRWRKGTSMPGRPRCVFAYASDSQRNVFVAGGQDKDRNALTSALKYDVVEDNWTLLPEMERARKACTAIFRGEKFYVIGGYTREEQGQFSKTAKSFDSTTWRWGQLEKDFLSLEMTPTCVAADGENGDLYACCRGDLMVMRGKTWQTLGNLPADVCNVSDSYMAVRRSGKLIVIGSTRCGKPSVGYNWDMSNTRIESRTLR